MYDDFSVFYNRFRLNTALSHHVGYSYIITLLKPVPKHTTAKF